MNTVVSNRIIVYDPSPALQAWCKNQLVLPNPDYQKKLRMGFWVGNTPEKLTLYERDGHSIILPFGTLQDIWPLIRDNPVDTDFPEPALVDYGSGEIPLYDYQIEAVCSMFDRRYGILQSPAGSGKTQMGIALIKRYERRALWITHTLDLLKQSKERAERYLDPAMMGTITEGEVNIGTGITFATIQTLSKLDLSQYRDIWDVVIVDECHHVAGSPTRLTQYYKALNALRARHKYGLSATVHRADGLIRATYAMLGPVMYTVPEEQVASKIMQVAVCPVDTAVGPSTDYLNPDGTMNFTRMITYLCGRMDRNRQIVKDIVRNRDHSCLILSDRVSHLQALRAMLPEDMFLHSALITGKMASTSGKAQRAEALERMREGTDRYLFATYALSKEGLDIPRLDRLFLTTPVKDEAVVIQSLGRVARTFPDKPQPIAYDYVDRIRYCQRAYRQRTKHYDKIGACYVNE